MPKTKPSRRSPGRIRKILSDLEASGLSRASFAAQSGIPLSTIHSWLKKAKSNRKPAAPKVISVGTLPAPAAQPIEIELPGGVVLRFGPGCQRQDLRLVLSELRRC
jgi:hypothetical protein